MVPDVDAACERFESLGVEFVKKPTDGKFLFIISLKSKFCRLNIINIFYHLR